MKISTEWTPEERLDIVHQLSAKLQKQVESGASPVTIQHWLQTIRLVAGQSSGFLEVNRRNVMDYYEESAA